MEQGYKNAGGWRFGQQMPGGILDLLKQYDPYAPGQDWSKISDINVPAKPGALDAATKGKDVGALASYGGGDYGGPSQEGGMSGGVGSQSMSPGGNSMTMASPTGLGIGMNGFAQGNMPGLLGMLGMNIGKQAPVFDLDQSAITQVDGRENGMGMFGNDALGQAVTPGEGFAGLGHSGYGGMLGAISNVSANENDNGGQTMGLGGFGIGDAAVAAGDAAAASAAADGNDGSSGVAWAKGGKVDKVAGPNPQGPDDGWGMLDLGEFVVKKNKAKKIGDKKLKALNEGKANVVMKKGL